MVEQGGRQAPGVEALTEKVKQLVHEGNTRRVVVRNAKGEPVLDIPVTAGVVAAVAAPVVTAVAAFAALAGPWSLGVERFPDAEAADAGSTEAGSTEAGSTEAKAADTEAAGTGAAGTGAAGTGAADAEPIDGDQTDGGASAGKADGTTPPAEG
ncbi:DUF4342 domain-containing protein [Saccharothrix saharensis]|uniref:DUF4342 domain-containing protein n=1 Tax=Saccharothrix saharensis TaxID=571190 RepID=UPI00369B97DE